MKTSFGKMLKPNEASIEAMDCGLIVDVLLQILSGTPADFNLAKTVQLLHSHTYQLLLLFSNARRALVEECFNSESDVCFMNTLYMLPGRRLSLKAD